MPFFGKKKSTGSDEKGISQTKKTTKNTNKASPPSSARRWRRFDLNPQPLPTAPTTPTTPTTPSTPTHAQTHAALTRSPTLSASTLAQLDALTAQHDADAKAEANNKNAEVKAGALNDGRKGPLNDGSRRTQHKDSTLATKQQPSGTRTRIDPENPQGEIGRLTTEDEPSSSRLRNACSALSLGLAQTAKGAIRGAKHTVAPLAPALAFVRKQGKDQFKKHFGGDSESEGGGKRTSTGTSTSRSSNSNSNKSKWGNTRGEGGDKGDEVNAFLEKGTAKTQSGARFQLVDVAVKDTGVRRRKKKAL